MTLESELVEALKTAGYPIARVVVRPLSRDSVEQRGALRETIDLVWHLLIFVRDNVDPEQAKALADTALTIFRRRRSEEVAVVDIYGPDGSTILLSVRARREAEDLGSA